MDTAPQLTATVDDLLSWRPCGEWTQSRICRIAGDRTKWTALDVLALEQVSAEDRLWVVLRPELIPQPLLHELACRFAEQALPIWEQKYPGDRRPHEAIAAKRAWLRGEMSDEELAATRAAALDAAYAGCAAAWSGWAAALDAARHVARYAARHAARYAVCAARDAQVDIVRELLSRPGGEEE